MDNAEYFMGGLSGKDNSLPTWLNSLRGIFVHLLSSILFLKPYVHAIFLPESQTSCNEAQTLYIPSGVQIIMFCSGNGQRKYY